jgi:hypothetical protein
MDLLDFEVLYELFNNTFTVPSSRGNHIVSVGYSAIDITERDDNYLHGPRISNQTVKFIPQMVALSQLLQKFWPIDKNSDRLQFAKKIHKDNCLEGFTCARTLMGTYNEDQKHFDTTKQQHVLCHFDKQNCRSVGNNYVIIASKVQEDKCNNIVRVAAIGYARKSVMDYILCKTQLTPLMRQIDFEIQMRGFNAHSIYNNCTIINGDMIGFVCFPREYVNCVLKLMTIFQLTIQDIAEMIYPLGFVNNGYFIDIMCCEFQKWIIFGILPKSKHYGMYLLQLCNLQQQHNAQQEKCMLIQYILAYCYEGHTTTNLSHSDVKKIHQSAMSHLLTKFELSGCRTLLSTIGYLCANGLLADVSIYCEQSPVCMMLAHTKTLCIEKRHIRKFLKAIHQKHSMTMMETERLVYDVFLVCEWNTVRNFLSEAHQTEKRQLVLSKLEQQREMFVKKWLRTKAPFSYYIITLPMLV